MEFINDLTPEQKGAFKRLEKAYSDCKKAGIYFVNVYGSLQAFDKEKIDMFSNTDALNDSDIDVVRSDEISTSNYITIPNEWTDDQIEHRFRLTPKGLKIFNNTK